MNNNNRKFHDAIARSTLQINKINEACERDVRVAEAEAEVKRTEIQFVCAR